MEDLLPPAAYNELGDHDGDDGVWVFGDETVDVVEDRVGEVPIWRVEDLQGDVAVVLGPFGSDAVGVAVFEGDVDGQDAIGP